MSILLILVAAWLTLGTLLGTAAYARKGMAGKAVQTVIAGVVLVVIVLTAALGGVTP